MAMTAGMVSVDNDGNVTGSDLARAFYDAHAATIDLPTPPTVGSTDAPFSTGRPASQRDHDLTVEGNVRALQGVADQATAYAAALVQYLKDNAQAKIADDATADNLMKDSTDSNCKHPASPKYLPVV